MNIIKAQAVLVNPFSDFMTDSQYMEQMLKHIEIVGRTCYKSENLITDNSYKTFIKGLINRNHEAMLEHGSFTVKFIVDRGISHELVRHRIASFAQESTRYCNYGKDKFGNEITVIEPFFFDRRGHDYIEWYAAMKQAEGRYLGLLNNGVKAEEARSVLPTSIKTELHMTANFREWRAFFKLRAEGVTGNPHPQMTEVTIPLLNYMKSICPVIFDDIVIETNE